MAPIFARESGTVGTTKRKAGPDDDMSRTPKKPRGERLARLIAEIENLQKLVDSAPTTKNEIKDAIRRLWPMAKMAAIEADTPRSGATTASKTATSDAGCQTVPPNEVLEELEVEGIRSDLKGDSEAVLRALQKQWPPSAFKATKITKSGLNKASENNIRVIISEADKIETDEHIQRLALSIPLIKRLNAKTLPPGKVAVVKSEEAIEIDGEKDGNNEQAIIIGSVQTTDLPNLIEMAHLVISAAHKTSASTTTVVFPPSVDPTLGRKIIETALVGVPMNGEIYASKAQRIQHQKESATKKGSSTPKQNSTLFLKAKSGQTFADMVKCLKAEIAPEKIGVKINNIAETRNGAVKVTYRQGEASNQSFFQEVKKAMGEKITCDMKQTTIIIQDIEPGCDEHFVVNALAKELAVDEGAIDASKIITGKKGNRLLFAKLEPEIAKRAIALRSLALDWTRARIRQKIEPDFCSNCQIYGHLQRECKAEHVPKRCRNCGSSAHLRQECKEETTCFSCKTKGHRADSMACPIYRKLVAEKQKKC